MNDTRSVHIPVLLHEVTEYLKPHKGDVIFDGTYGGGGYSRAILEAIGTQGRIIATDQDREVVVRETARNKTDGVTNIHLVHANFSEIQTVAQEAAIDAFDGLMLDLGISSDQLENRERGISFQHPDAPLDMRMNAAEDNFLTAWGIVNSWEEQELADVLFHYGGERNSRRIARGIVQARERQYIETVGDLLAVIETATPGRGKTHPATKTFQALRIVVNNELGSLETFLEQVPQVAKKGTRVVIVSFHSLEERIVKQAFRTWKQDKAGTIDTPKSVGPTREEEKTNRRSRSARLRSFTFN